MVRAELQTKPRTKAENILGDTWTDSGLLHLLGEKVCNDT